MDVTLLLCDHAEAITGQLYVMGGGWNLLLASGQPVNTSVAALLAVPWDRTNQRHELRLELVTGDGDPVEVNGQPLSMVNEFELGRPPGTKPGSSLNAPFVWNVNGLVLEAGSYEWKLAIDGEPAAGRAFTVAPRPTS